jgi:hypothetical protein
MTNQAREVFCQGNSLASLMYAIYVLRAHRLLSRRLYAASLS